VKLRTQHIVLFVCAGALLAFVAAMIVRHAHRDRLRLIVQEQCVPRWLKTHDPAPCLHVNPAEADRATAGSALLADRKGGAHLLLIPARTISGIESPELRDPGTLNYFEAAWKERDVLSVMVGHGVPRTAVGMAVNQLRARSQDQLHIHLSCLRRPLYETLQAEAERIGAGWSPLSIDGFHYQAMRVMGAELGASNPFALLADRLPGASGAMDQFTLLVAGMQFKDGPGFVVLAGTSVPGAELLLDSSCAVAG